MQNFFYAYFEIYSKTDRNTFPPQQMPAALQTPNINNKYARLPSISLAPDLRSLHSPLRVKAHWLFFIWPASLVPPLCHFLFLFRKKVPTPDFQTEKYF